MIELSEDERAELVRRAGTVTLPFRTVQRARMMPYAASGLQDIIADDYVSHGPQAPPAAGPEGVKARISVYQDALDGYWDVQEICSAGERVVVRWIGRGTHSGELMGVPPTGATVAVDAITILRIAADKIAEEWTVCDAIGLLQQVGAMALPA